MDPVFTHCRCSDARPTSPRSRRRRRTASGLGCTCRCRIETRSPNTSVRLQQQADCALESGSHAFCSGSGRANETSPKLWGALGKEEQRNWTSSLVSLRMVRPARLHDGRKMAQKSFLAWLSCPTPWLSWANSTKVTTTSARPIRRARTARKKKNKRSDACNCWKCPPRKRITQHQRPGFDSIKLRPGELSGCD